jgi:hypothetical protein
MLCITAGTISVLTSRTEMYGSTPLTHTGATFSTLYFTTQTNDIITTRTGINRW